MFPIAGVVATTVAVVGAAALVTVAVIPLGQLPQVPVWMDQPIAGDVWAQGEHQITIHAATQTDVTQFRVTIEKDGEPDGTRNTSDPSALTNDLKQELVTGEVDWTPDGGGDYVLTPAFLADGSWRIGADVPITVAKDPDWTPPVGVTVPGPVTTPTASLTPTPTPSATAAPTVAPTSAPASPKPSAPAPTPTPTSTFRGVSSGIVTHTVQGQQDVLTATGFLPANSTVDIQIQVEFGDAQPTATGWQSEGCSNTTQTISGSTCSTSVMVPQKNEVQTVYFRDVVSYLGQSGVGRGGKWTVPVLIH